MVKVKRSLRAFAAIAAMVISLTGMTFDVKADGVDANREVSLTIHAQDPETNAAIEGMRFNAYRVSELKNTGEYAVLAKLSDDVKRAYERIDTPSPSAEACSEFARTVAGYFTSDSITPDATGTTDASGNLRFGGSGLKSGMYVVTGEQYQVGNRYYTAGEFLIALPTRSETGAEWTFDVAVSAKLQVRVEQVETISRRVLKRWVGDGGTNARPAYVDIELLRNGITYDTQRLTEANGWAYQWDGLNPNDRWTVIERNVAANYSVTVEQEGITLLVTNTYTPPGEVEGVSRTPEIPDEPEEKRDVPVVAGVRRPEPGPDVPETISEVLGASRLPQTGVLWWPVPILFLAGGLMFIYGFRDMRREEE